MTLRRDTYAMSLTPNESEYSRDCGLVSNGVNDNIEGRTMAWYPYICPSITTTAHRCSGVAHVWAINQGAEFDIRIY